jgi:hypothetical protein
MHGNAKENPNAHHLYRIFKLAGRETFKYGISDDPVDPEDSLSARVRDQVEEWNLAAEYNKFGAEILMRDIAGREAALRLERLHIDAYYQEHGENPPGNKFPKRK